VAGWSLFDLGWTRDRDALRMELDGPDERAVFVIAKGTRGCEVRGPEYLAGLTDALRRRLSGPLQTARGIATPDRASLSSPLVAAPAWSPGALPETPEAALLDAEMRNYAAHCGRAPAVLDLGGTERALRYPPSRTQAVVGAMKPLDIAILERRAHRESLSALGFGLEGDTLRVVPTPATFRARVLRSGRPPAILPVLRSILGTQFGREWTDGLVRGEFVVGVPRPWFLRVPMVRTPVSTLAHDLGFHCLAFRWIDPDLWADLVADVPPAGARSAAFVGAVTTWMEGELTRLCWEAWASVDRPEDIPSALAQRWPALRASLADLPR
jgi:hypothetical protein